MPDIAKPLLSFAILILLFLTPIFFIHDYATDTTSNLSSSTLTRLTEVNARASSNFYQTVRSSMMEMNGMTKYLAQQNCGASKDEVLAVAPLFSHTGYGVSALLIHGARALMAAEHPLISARMLFFCWPTRAKPTLIPQPIQTNSGF